jgi:hypothetical protein
MSGLITIPLLGTNNLINCNGISVPRTGGGKFKYLERHEVDGMPIGYLCTSSENVNKDFKSFQPYSVLQIHRCYLWVLDQETMIQQINKRCPWFREANKGNWQANSIRHMKPILSADNSRDLPCQQRLGRTERERCTCASLSHQQLVT